MDALLTYLREAIQPRNETEWVIREGFDRNLFDRMVQDGLYVSREAPPPGTPFCETLTLGDFHLSRKIFREIAWWDVSGETPALQFDSSRDPIYRRLIPPPYETFQHVRVLQTVAMYLATLGPVTYVEYGVSSGVSLLGVLPWITRAYAVDILPKPEKVVSDKVEFTQSRTDVFSRTRLPSLQYNLAFIDADHSFAAAYDDFQHVYRSLSRGGYVLLHDTYPCEAFLLQPNYCNDCFLTPLHIKKDYPEAQVFTFPLNPGVTVVRKP